MKRINIGYHIFFITLLFISCTHPEPLQEELIGSWTNSDGARIIFNKKHNITIENFPINVEVTNEGIVSGYGKWTVGKSKSISPFWIVEIDFTINKKNVQSNKKGILRSLLVSRSGLRGSSSEITSLFIWKGDPDEDYRYEFYKE